MSFRTTLTVVACLAVLLAASALGAQQGATAEWPAWGGPRGDFTSSAIGLADTWPTQGPQEIWRQELGEGASAIVVEGDRLFTMYRSTLR